MTEFFLPYGRQTIEADDLAAVEEILHGDFLTTGPSVAAFERAFADKVGARFAVACSSGTAALHLTALAMELGAGDVVISPTMSFLATANAARYVGAEVAFADVDAETGLVTASDLETAFARSDNNKAIYVVHLAGQCADMETVSAFARNHGLMVVEDACHAVGSTWRSADGEEIRVGSCSHSDMTVFSFHPVKTITTGEGGMVTTNDEDLYARLLLSRNHGMTREEQAFENTDLAFDARGGANPWYYEMHDIGFNYRLTDLQCALGLRQLDKLDGFVTRRRALAEKYDAALVSMAPVVKPPKRVADQDPAWHLYAPRIDFTAAGVDRATVMGRLRESGIGSQVHYIPIHLQPFYRRRYGEFQMPGAMNYYRRTLSLPLFPAMEEADVDRVVASLIDALSRS